MTTRRLEELLVEHRAVLDAVVRHDAGPILKFETAEDLVQGIQLRALTMRTRFDYRGEPAFLAWLREIARGHLADRRDYWRALKRHSGRVLRLTSAMTNDKTGAVPDQPRSSATGPSTFAVRREELNFVARALGLLSPRDRELVQWQSEGLSTQEQAQRLGMSMDSVRRAAQRALERFQKTWRLLRQGSPVPVRPPRDSR